MVKNSIFSTTTETTITTTTTTTASVESEKAPVIYMPIDPVNEPGAEAFYKANGIPVVTMTKFGKQRVYALIPATEIEVPEEEQANAAKDLTRHIDNYRRKSARTAHKIYSHETTSLNNLLDVGYDPTLDNIDIAIKIAKESPSDTTATKPSHEGLTHDGKRQRNKGAYDSSSDCNNPESVFITKASHEAVRTVLEGLEGEELDLANLIIGETTVAELLDKLAISRSTLYKHRDELLTELKKLLKNYE
ncbi:MAG: hypothetical protein IKY23_11345 [Lachnospiraceae bacterium]|nr:hypothetical protein [Lachnospiraceae bacterium]